MNSSTLWPTWMEDPANPEHRLLAKSADFGGDTLAKHTWDVLSRLSDQLRLRPNLHELAGERVWARMFWGCFLHDFGKAAAGFQNILRKREDIWAERRHRHEILSLAFVDWLFPKGHPDREWVIAVIAFHHKDANEIFDKYGGKAATHQMQPNDLESVQMMLNELAAHIAPDTRVQLWRWIDECALAWADTLGFQLEDIPQLLPLEEAQTTQFPKTIFRALRDFAEWSKQLNEAQKAVAMLYRGLILTSDHAASAGVTDFPQMPAPDEWRQRPNQLIWRAHQEAADGAPLGSAIMIAPTGSGKTEAAILWAARQMEHRPAARLFYTLPYQASMNAMYKRLGNEFLGIENLSTEDNIQITIQHSRALLKFYQDMMNDERTPREATEAAKYLRNRARLHFYPVQIFSPYQMLKAAYGLKGYEALLVDYTDGLFIFDEIHAYEPKRMALIISMIGWLATNFRARFLIMTATLPPMVKNALQSVLPDCHEIEATPELFAESQRHRVQVHQGNLIDQLDLILADYHANKAVLVCCNQIAVAQEVYRQLAAQIPENDLLQLHGRFNGRDRSYWEQQLAEAVGVGVENKRRPFILVATQVVEVSLNVDFDTLYTDPAPLEALLQRFGRVNRGRPKGDLLPVHVFEHPSNPFDKDDPYKPYDMDIVEASIRVLQSINGQPIDEGQVNEMLAEIYQGPIAAKWQAEYDNAERDFKRAILDNLRPYQSAEVDTLKKFYSLFDGVQVLPVNCEQEYYAARDRGDFLGATQYFVNLSYGQYRTCLKRGLIIPKDTEVGEYVDHINVEYTSERGLALYEALQQRDEDE